MCAWRVVERKPTSSCFLTIRDQRLLVALVAAGETLDHRPVVQGVVQHRHLFLHIRCLHFRLVVPR